MKSKLIFITNNNPFNKDDGGKILSDLVLNELNKYFKIDLIILEKNDKNIPKYINKYKTFKKNNWYLSFIKSFINGKPAYYNRYSVKKAIQYFQSIVNTFDYIFVDHLGCFSILFNLVNFDYKSKQLFFLDHNLEYKVWEDYVKLYNYPIIKNIFKKQKNKVFKFEKKCFKKSDRIFLVSKKEEEIVQNCEFVDNGKIEVLPIFLENKNEINNVKIDNDEIKLLFTASFKWYPNQNAVNWFLSNCWDRLKKEFETIKLVLAGNDPTGFAKELANRDENIISTGYVKDMDHYFRNSDIYILPIQIGAGIKIKFFEAMSYGMPLVTTKKGIEGIKNLNGEVCLSSENPKEFIENIINLVESKKKRSKLSNNALKFMKSQKIKFQNIFKKRK